jgi:hypothetical protein
MRIKVAGDTPKQENAAKAAFCAIQAVSCRAKDWRKRVRGLAEDLMPNVDVSGLYKRIPRTIARDGKKPRELIYVAVGGDIHIPFHNQKALLLWLQFIKDVQPDKIIILGDVVDFPGISRFNKTLTDEADMVRACLLTRKFFALVRSLCPEAEIIFTEGNHENRWDRRWAQDENRAMGGVASVFMTLADIFGLREFDIKFYAYEDNYVYKNFTFTHKGRLFSGNDAGSMSARKTFQGWKCSGIIGHSHRGGTFPQHNRVGDFEVAENYCLCKLNPPWIKDPDWMNGHTLIRFNQMSDRFHITPMPIVGDAFVYGDKIYRA